MKNIIPGSEVQAAGLSSIYDKGTPGYENFIKLPLQARQKLYAENEDVLKLRGRYSEDLPFILSLKCAAESGNGRHRVSYDFGSKRGIHSFEVWVKDNRYTMYQFLDIPADDPKRSQFSRPLLLREGSKVDDCCRKSLGCSKIVNDYGRKALLPIDQPFFEKNKIVEGSDGFQ